MFTSLMGYAARCETVGGFTTEVRFAGLLSSIRHPRFDSPYWQEQYDPVPVAAREESTWPCPELLVKVAQRAKVANPAAIAAARLEIVSSPGGGVTFPGVSPRMSFRRAGLPFNNAGDTNNGGGDKCGPAVVWTAFLISQATHLINRC